MKLLWKRHTGWVLNFNVRGKDEYLGEIKGGNWGSRHVTFVEFRQWWMQDERNVSMREQYKSSSQTNLFLFVHIWATYLKIWMILWFRLLVTEVCIEKSALISSVSLAFLSVSLCLSVHLYLSLCVSFHLSLPPLFPPSFLPPFPPLLLPSSLSPSLSLPCGLSLWGRLTV